MELAKILLVEDCDSDADFLRRFFKEERICNCMTWVTTVSDAKLHVQSGTRFDLLIVDIRIPGNGGLEFIEWTRTLPGYNDIPVIVSSGVEYEADVKKACQLGVLAYIVKPMTPEKWWPVIKELKKLHIGLMVGAPHDLHRYA